MFSPHESCDVDAVAAAVLEPLEPRLLLSSVQIADYFPADVGDALPCAPGEAAEVCASAFHRPAAGRNVRFTDSDGDLVTVTLRGKGDAEVVLAAGGIGDAMAIRLTGTNALSRLAIAVRKAGGGDGQTTIGEIAVAEWLDGPDAVDDAGSLTGGTVKRLTINGRLDQWIGEVQSLGALTAGAIGQAELSVTDALGKVKAWCWSSGVIEADTLGARPVLPRPLDRAVGSP